MKEPVLLLVFNRPDLVARVFPRIREVQPARLFVAADRPCPNHPEDSELCERLRDIATKADWDCELYTLFRDQNLGCKEAVGTAITWFFEHVERGIILEDDCVPHPSFFRYCGTLLERYAEDERVMAISGDNFQPDGREYEASYYFSAYPHVWGWATWRRAWQHYDPKIEAWQSLRETGWLQGWLGSAAAQDYWTRIFDRVAREEIDTWDYPWTFSCWAQHGLTVLPSVNLVSNIGFGKRGTHTQGEGTGKARLPVEKLAFPLEHPETTVPYYQADRYTSIHHFGTSESPGSERWGVVKWVPRNLKRLARPLLKEVQRQLQGG